MSIATRIQAMSNHIRADYIAIRRLGVDTENIEKNIDNIASLIDTAYANLPKITREGSSLSLTPTRKGGLSIIPKGTCEQDSYSGKNKLKNGATTGTTNGITYTINDDGTFTISGSASANAIKVLQQFSGSDLFSAGTYILSIGNTLPSSTNASFVRVESSVDKSTVKNTYDLRSTTETSLRFTISQDSYLKVSFVVGNGADITNNLKYYPMIRLSSITDDTFEKYVGGIPSPNPDYPQSVRVVTGDNTISITNKNLFPLSKLQNASGKSCVTKTETGFRLTKDGSDRFSDWFPIYLKAGETYKFVGTRSSNDSNTNHNVAFDFRDANNTQSSEYINVGESFTAQNNIVRARLFIQNQYTDNNYYEYTDFMILKSAETDLTYVEGQQQITTLHLGTNYLAGIGDYKDEIVGKTDDWKIKRYVGKVNFKDFSFTLNATLTSVVRARATLINNAISTPIGLCDGFVFRGEYSTDNEHFYCQSGGLFVFISKSRLSAVTQAGINAFIQANNFYAYYPIATTIEIPITDTTLISDLNNMYQAMGYDGTTNITITSNPNNAQMTASVSALKGE